MKKLSKEQMKNVKGGLEDENLGGCPDGGMSQGNDYIHCKNGRIISSNNKCSNSVGVCDNYGGFDYCVCL